MRIMATRKSSTKTKRSPKKKGSTRSQSKSRNTSGSKKKKSGTQFFSRAGHALSKVPTALASHARKILPQSVLPEGVAGYHDGFSFANLLFLIINLGGSPYLSHSLPYTHSQKFTLKGINQLLFGDVRWVLPLVFLGFIIVGATSGQKTWGFFRKVLGILLTGIGIIGMNGASIPPGVKDLLPHDPAGIVGSWFGSVNNSWLGVMGSQIFYTLIIVTGVSILCGIRWDKIIPKVIRSIRSGVERFAAWVVDGIPPIDKVAMKEAATRMRDTIASKIPFAKVPVTETVGDGVSDMVTENMEPDVAPEPELAPSYAAPVVPPPVQEEQPEEHGPYDRFVPRFRYDPTYANWEMPDWADLFPAHSVDHTYPPTHEARLEQFFNNYQIDATITSTTVSPSVILYSCLLGDTTPVGNLLKKEETLKYTLGTSEIRIYSPIEGQQRVGIEIPRPDRETVFMSHMSRPPRYGIPMGVAIDNSHYLASLQQFPHLLVGGQTGGGKSSFINTAICALMGSTTPNDTRFVLIDPKMVEFVFYQRVPYLGLPVITQPDDALDALTLLADEMEDRYQLLSLAKCRDITRFNNTVSPTGSRLDPSSHDLYYPLPRIVCIVDELADLMLNNSIKKDVENLIVRLSQKGRAAGIHMILATQRPSVNVVTGLIKANAPSRLAFTVSKAIDSNIILDMKGAEALAGKGDALFLPAGARTPVRIQCPFLSDDDVENVCTTIEGASKKAYRNQPRKRRFVMRQ